MTTYNPITKESLLGSILIEIRKKHVIAISRELILNRIIPIEYIDKLLKADIINNKSAEKKEMPNIFTEEQRIEKINKLLQKHCALNTAYLINELCE